MPLFRSTARPTSDHSPSSRSSTTKSLDVYVSQCIPSSLLDLTCCLRSALRSTLLCASSSNDTLLIVHAGIKSDYGISRPTKFEIKQQQFGHPAASSPHFLWRETMSAALRGATKRLPNVAIAGVTGAVGQVRRLELILLCSGRPPESHFIITVGHEDSILLRSS